VGRGSESHLCGKAEHSPIAEKRDHAQALANFKASERTTARTLAAHEAIRFPRSVADTKALNLERAVLKDDKAIIAGLKHRSLQKLRRDLRTGATLGARTARAFLAIGAPMCA
jgi:hypothetical protein